MAAVEGKREGVTGDGVQAPLDRRGGDLAAAARGYLWVVRSVLGDALPRFRGRAALVVGANLAEIGGRGAAAALISLFAYQMETGEAAELLGGAVRLPVTLAGLYGVAAALCVLLAAAGASGAWGRYKSLRLAGDYELLCSQRVFAAAERIPMDVAEVGGIAVERRTLQLCSTSDSRMCGRTLRALLNGILAPAAFIGFAAVLAWLDPKLSLYLAVVGLCALPALYRVNVRASVLSRRFERLRLAAGPERRHLIARVAGGAGPRETSDPTLARYYREGASEGFVRAFNDRMFAVEQSRLVATLVFAVGILVVLAVGGAEAMRGARTWSGFLAYVIVVRMAFAYLVNSVDTATQLNIFYPHVARYFRFLHGAAACARRQASPRSVPAAARLRLGAPLLLADDAPAELGPHAALAVLADGGASRFVIPPLAACAEADPRHARAALFARAAIVAQSAPAEGEPLRLSLALPAEARAGDLRARLEDAGLDEAARWLTDALLDEGAAAGFWRRAPTALDPALRLAAAALSPHPTVVVDARVAGELPRRACEALLRALAGRLRLFVYPPNAALHRLLAFDEAGLAFVADGEVRWQVSRRRFAEPRARERVQAALEAAGTRKRAAEAARAEPADLASEEMD